MKDETLYRVSEILGPPLVGLIARTVRMQYVGLEHKQAAEEAGGYLLAMFHGRMFLPVWHLRKKGFTALVSSSRDGEAVTRLVAKLGHDTVRGSSHRGASRALKGMVSAIKNGNNGAVMVDGPKGPIHDPKIGTIAIARLAGVPILPLLASANPHKQFGSWDRFQLPLPFSRGVMLYGPPLVIPKRADKDEMERLRLELQRRMLEMKDKADRIVINREDS